MDQAILGKKIVYHLGVLHLGETKFLLCISAWLCFSDRIAVFRASRSCPAQDPES